MLQEFVYCDNTVWLGLRQPWNVLSNGIFILLAAWVWRMPSAARYRYGLVLIALGSVLWHAVGESWALWLDVGAIALCLVLYALDASDRSVQKKTTLLCLLVGVVGVAIASAKLLQGAMPMFSGAFVPYVLIAGGVAIAERHHRKRCALFALSALCMMVAIAMREIDLHVCQDIPIGTHWLWHIGAGLSLLGPIHALRSTAIDAP